MHCQFSCWNGTYPRVQFVNGATDSYALDFPPADSRGLTPARILHRPVLVLLAPILWMGLIFLVSHQSTLPSVRAEWLDVTLKQVGHFASYVILGLLIWRSFGGPRVGRLGTLGALTVCVAYAVFDEAHQTFVPGRTGSWTDVAVDSGGSLAGVWAIPRTPLKFADLGRSISGALRRLI